MAVSPWVVKGLIGLGGISVVSVGGVVVHQGYLSGNSKDWKVETKEDGNSIIVSVIKSEKSGEWVCQIKTTKPTDTTKKEGIKSQIKEKLGIKNDGTTNTEKKDQLNKFIENCKNYKSSSGSTMDLGSIALDESGEDSYKLKDIEFDKTFKEIYLTKEYKDSLGLPADCKVMEGSDSKSCDLNADALKKVRFEGKTENTQTNLTGDTKVTLKIEQRAGKGKFPENLRFVFVANPSVTVSSGSPDSTPISLGTGTEFKVKTNGATNTLEKTSE